MPKAQQTLLEINLSNLKHNYNYLRSKLPDRTKVLGVVKAFAYGSDAVQIAQSLQEFGAEYLAVAYTHEGELLRDAGITLPILVLHPQPVNFETLIERCLEPSLYNAKVLKEFITFAQSKSQKNYPVHIKFNTGLNRLGFWENDVDFITKTIAATESIKVASLFSHLAASEDENELEFSNNQIQTFNTIAQAFSSALNYRPMLHMCNTSGILNFPEAHFDMVRSGIGLYGFGNSEEENTQLKPIASLKTVISQLHKIEPGESVGYNRAYAASDFELIATLPIGHADGIGRQYGLGKGYVMINGEKAPIVGNVCMDMMMVNATGINCQEGDEVVVFDDNDTAEELAATANTISYELITSISQRVKRVYLPA